jgi:hypothetical protein
VASASTDQVFAGFAGWQGNEGATLTAVWGTVFAAMTLGMATGLAQEPERVTTVFERAIPNIPGKSLIALAVSYPQGGRSRSHRHAGTAFIYAQVLSGAVRSQDGVKPASGTCWGRQYYRALFST